MLTGQKPLSCMCEVKPEQITHVRAVSQEVESPKYSVFTVEFNKKASRRTGAILEGGGEKQIKQVVGVK